MKDNPKLYMILLGCTPEGRYTEQHDIFFGIGQNLKDLIPQMNAFWSEAKGRIHIDAWREVTMVDNFSIEIVAKKAIENSVSDNLFFINLGGYKENEFEEYHYKMLTIAENLSAASKNAKTTTFYKHCGFKGATSHIDDKYGIDVDDIYNVADILDASYKEKYSLKITKVTPFFEEDTLHIGYLKLDKI
ncbi:DUF1543 domain-containing protein [Flavobacterium franklandianum]|uniref:DUF1543 domain-containing protein n=1 Tax=Flavobacterium franklandianum TaxID=2594430 RepID=A0A553CJP6_9FLAO|nr:DUF1543 domain-containing protein [Flavobacterium franklandianum]TRX20722.1 DUF1543 domain-containing protein [Flavobacterium franklandianum]TRX23286.1 DUF1543 domain-containing protein [Flavobacterium franklandianum]